MKIKKLSAGDIIEARCTRCRDILNHRIVAMVAEKVVRVECNTCSGVHNYYAPPSEKPVKPASTARPASPRSGSAARTAAPRSNRKDPAEADRQEWTALRSAMQTDLAIGYDMNGKYRVNTLLDHSTFGLGVVKQVIPPNKMQVLFQDGIKLLRCRAL